MSDSYPPHLLRLPGTQPDAPRRGDLEAGRVAPAVPVQQAAGQQSASPALLASAGRPGAFAPPVSPGERPRTMTEFRERVTPQTPEPWPLGTWVLMGTTGKRVHWTGADWKQGESPGYAAGELATVRSETEQTEGGQS